MSAAQRVHFVGIGGIGMSAIAKLLLEEGRTITGCDISHSAITAGLEQAGIRVHLGHDPEHLDGVTLVVVTAAVRADNPEIQRALAMGIPVMKRAEVLGRLMAEKSGVAIAGTHGKTTTTSLVSLALVRGGLDPTVLVGGEVPELGGNARRGRGLFLVAEADEFDGSFLALKPEVAVVTNIEPEHLDYYRTFQGVVDAFQQFLEAVPPSGHIVFCLDDPVLAGLQSNRGGASKLNHKASPAGEVLLAGALQTQSLISYGFHPAARWRAEHPRPNSLGGTDFLALLDGSGFQEFSLRIPGRHNVSNALAMLATCHHLGIDSSVLKEVLSGFGGVNRRFQVLGEVGGITVVDDYAHHPTEIKATLAAARQRYGARPIRCVFQPHTYSRTKLLMPLFADAFRDADSVYVTEIYAAREDNTWGVTGADLAHAIKHKGVTFAPTLDEAADYQIRHLSTGDVLLVMGAGDIYQLGPKVLEGLRKRAGAR